jgi:cytochrome c551/c552
MAENAVSNPQIIDMIFNRTEKNKPWMIASMVLVSMTGCCMAAASAEKVFQQNCMACHQVENKKEPIVGPSLVEIAHIYKKDVAGFVKWCNAPKKKRKDAIEMPSMAHVGNDNLKLVHAWILNETKGKKFVPEKKNEKKKKTDPYARTVSEGSQPSLQRIFLADSSPASIAVTIDGQHSLCWDTVSCRMRYAWKGDRQVVLSGGATQPLWSGILLCSASLA